MINTIDNNPKNENLYAFTTSFGMAIIVTSFFIDIVWQKGFLFASGGILMLSLLMNFSKVFNHFDLTRFKAILFDFTIDSSDKNIIEKILKYSKKDVLLIIVSLRDTYISNYKPIPDDIYIHYSDRVSVIDYNGLKKLFPIYKNMEKKFDKIIELISREDLKGLIIIPLLPKEKRLSTPELETEVYIQTGMKIKFFFPY